MTSDGDDDYGEYEVRGRRHSHSARRRRPHLSGFMSSESHELESDSEAEVESLLILSPSRPNVERRGRPRGRSKRRRPRQCLSSGSSDSERAYGSEFETESPPRRNVRFTLSQGRTDSWPGHTNISGGNQSSVGGSQKIIADHRYRRYDTRNHNHTGVVNYGLVNIHIHVDQGDAKIWVFSVGLFGRGDSMTMRYI